MTTLGYATWVPTFTFLEKPWTTNAERRHRHWAARAQHAKRWRDAFGSMSRLMVQAGMLPFDVYEVKVRPSIAKGRLPDADAFHPSAKAAVDGLVDGGLLPDDSPKYMKRLSMYAPVKGADALSVTVEVWNGDA